MTYDQYLSGMSYFLAAFPNQRFGEETLAAWWMALQNITEDEYQLAIAKLVSDNKAWFPSNNFAGAVNEIVRNTSPRFQQGHAELPPPPKQLPEPRHINELLVGFHRLAFDRAQVVRQKLKRDPYIPAKQYNDLCLAEAVQELEREGVDIPTPYRAMVQRVMMVA